MAIFMKDRRYRPLLVNTWKSVAGNNITFWLQRHQFCTCVFYTVWHKVTVHVKSATWISNGLYNLWWQCKFFALISIILRVVCAKFICILCSLQTAWVYSFNHAPWLITEHLISMATTTKLRGLSLHANYTDRAAAAGWRS